MTAPLHFVCIHGHFYQPPRENPWTSLIDPQPTAAPFHDWNERITAECYAPNATSRLLHADGSVSTVNNFERISFNFGPTLLSWLESHSPDAYRNILAADRNAAAHFSGHGPAIAQVYNHVIMPLAPARDRITQIRWGIADFVRRFARAPEAMWLAETAVDRDTLDLLAQHGLKFVILAPAQCAHFRRIGNTKWHAADESTLNTRRAYRISLNHGRTIAAFFYDGALSQAVAFEGLLHDGEKFAARILSAFDPTDRSPQLVHIATDGESYGHHHKYGDMALSAALAAIESHPTTALTTYGEFLARFAPEWEAEVRDNTAWSCQHGLERWRAHCGCNTRPDWQQQWRTPLRNALETLRDRTHSLARERAANLLDDYDIARNSYISVVLDAPIRSDSPSTARFLAAHARRPLAPGSAAVILDLMELERNSLLMFTSCGWFFDDITNIETVQVLAYATRVIELAQRLFGDRVASLEPEFIRQLADAPGNLLEFQDAAAVYREHFAARIQPSPRP